jgi:hypothetical protein
VFNVFNVFILKGPGIFSMKFPLWDANRRASSIRKIQSGSQLVERNVLHFAGLDLCATSSDFMIRHTVSWHRQSINEHQQQLRPIRFAEAFYFALNLLQGHLRNIRWFPA